MTNKTMLWLAIYLVVACDSNNPDPTGPGSGKALKKVSEYNINHGNPELPNPETDVVWTFYFTKAGKFDSAVAIDGTTLRNDSAYDAATRDDTLSVGGLGPYPAYKQYKGNRKLDAYGHLIAYSEVYQYATGSDTSYNYWFRNEYQDGEVTGGIPE